jgi:hypothetical protein
MMRLAVASLAALLLLAAPSPAIASGGNAGDAVALSFLGPAEHNTDHVLATVGGYHLIAHCEAEPGADAVALYANGPIGGADISLLMATDDNAPYQGFAETKQINFHQNDLVAGTSALTGHFARASGTVMIHTADRTIEITLNEVADARPGNDDCFVYGTAIDTRAATSRPGDAAELAYGGSPGGGYLKLAAAGPFEIEASCRPAPGGVRLSLAAERGPVARFSNAQIDEEGDATNFAAAQSGGKLPADAHGGNGQIVSASETQSGQFRRVAGTAFVTAGKDEVRVDYDGIADNSAGTCTIHGTATLVARHRRDRGDAVAVRSHLRPGSSTATVGGLGPYSFDARCERISGVKLELSENGPKTLDNYLSIEDTQDNPPFVPYIGGAVIPAKSPDVPLVFPFASPGTFARHDGTSFLESRRGLVGLTLDAVADARSSHRGCTIAGSATLAG